MAILSWVLAGLLVSVAAAASASGNRVTDFGFDSGSNVGSSANRGGSMSSNRGSSSSSSGASWMDDQDDDDTPKINAWTNRQIPYEIAPEISSSNAAALKRMFQDIADQTCVKFVLRLRTDPNYVLIKGGNKCSAPLGMPSSLSSSSLGSSGNSGSRGSSSSAAVTPVISNVVLGTSCFTTKRVGRRLMNLLGIPHETSRPDRDQFVEINMKNIRTGYDNQLKQLPASAYLPGVLNVPYDLQSITQYADEDIAKDSSTYAIRSKARRSADIGGSVFSPADYEKIRRAYNCPSTSSSSNRGRA